MTRFKGQLIKALLSLALLAGAMLGWSCPLVATPVPEPPDLDPPNTDLFLVQTVPSLVDTIVELNGEPGAAEPGATLRIVDLDSTQPPVDTLVGPDGSFAVTVNTTGGRELRVQLRTADGQRSPPVDLRVPPAMEPVRPEVVTREPCLTVTPALELDFGNVDSGQATRSITLENNCGAELLLDTLELRVSTPAFVLGNAPPLTIVDGERISLEVTFEPQSEGLTEEVLLIGASAPIQERWPITLVGHLPVD
jgi:hypothetical protein